ncbi:MAG: glycosyltransferase family 4 protein [Candidatus Micrarchaeota archaeon]|nr:glycosyltransferase family 4 protein [Candidatus Micrarchaeota archaeon]
MKIAMLGWEFPPFVSGGLGTHCFELTYRLAKFGVQIDFFLPVGAKQEGMPPSLRLIEVAKTIIFPYLSFSKSKSKPPSYGENLIAAVEEYSRDCVRVVLEEAKKSRYDLLHSHDWMTASAALQIRKILNIPWVHTFHSTEFDRTSWPWEYIVGIERMAACEADRIIAVSKRTKEQVLRLGAAESKIRVIYNGVNFERFASSSIPSHSTQIKKEKQIVLFFGRLTEQKGPVQFLHAAKKVLEKKPNTLFLVAGKGELLPLLINISMQLGISHNVRFLGFVPEEEQRMIYKLADVYVMPSTSEPFGITALEAMSSGTPVIISKTSGVSEIIKAAIRVDFWDINAMAEKIIAVLSYTPLSKTMSQLGMKEASLHTWDKTAKETLELYKEVSKVF